MGTGLLILLMQSYLSLAGTFQRRQSSGLQIGRHPSGTMASDFVVLTEDGTMSGFDSCGRNIWQSNLGRLMMNANNLQSQADTSGPRMVPAVDGSMYVVFPSNPETGETNIAHVNATIMSVVAESPFSTPAFPNAYLTGSKVQSIEVLDFGESFQGWSAFDEKEYQETRARLSNRKLIYTTNQWVLTCIETSTQLERWSLLYTDIPAMTSSHLIQNSIEHEQVERLSNDIEIVTNRHHNRIMKRSECIDGEQISIDFDSQIIGVYAILDPPDTDGNLALVIVGKNTALPTNFGGLPRGLYFSVLEAATSRNVPESDLLGVRVGYKSNGPFFSQYDRATASPNALAIRSPHVWDPSSMTPYLLTSDRDRALMIDAPPPREYLVSQFHVLDFLTIKFSLLPWQGKVYLVTMIVLLIYLSRMLYKKILRRFVSTTRVGVNQTTLSIFLPDRGTLANSSTVTLSSPASTSSNRMVVIPSEAIHPYEVLTVGHSDTVEFASWQSSTDVATFDKKIKDISERLTKLPFAPSRKDYTAAGDHQIDNSGSPSKRQSIEDSSNMTVLFLGRNVDEPKLVFRNPRAENVVQRSNIPIYTQSIRNAVASSALRESPSMKAYIPRALCGYWNTFQGVFQEYVVPNKSAKNVTIASLIESPQTARDTAFLILLLRDTDAHEGNYTRDIRRKIALFDLGCSLGDRPLARDEIERLCLDNFELWKRVPFLLDCPFENHHIDLLLSLDFPTLANMWKNFQYPQTIHPGDRLVHPIAMLKILEINAKFLLACARSNRTILFAAEVMYSGMYDDVWLEVGAENLEVFESRLKAIAESSVEMFPNLETEKGMKSDRAKAYLETSLSAHDKNKDD